MSEDSDKEFDATLQRIADGVPEEAQHPDFDPGLHAEHVLDCKNGRKIEDYKQCLERAGFVYFPPERLRPWESGMPKTRGEWRFRQGDLRFAFTDDDVCAWFTGPEELWTWMQNQINAAEIKKARAESQRRIFSQVPR